MTNVPIKDAATIVLLRRDTDETRVLMGQRGSKAAFMPDKFVFPGGRVDHTDYNVPGVVGPDDKQRMLLNTHTQQDVAEALTNAAIRELWEETGLIMGRPTEDAHEVAPDWHGFFAQKLVPDASHLTYFFRAVTPPGRPRRFDARFFLGEASGVAGDLDDFSSASGELSHLQWVDLKSARNFSLPFITEIVLSEVEDILAKPDQARTIPFFDHSEEGSSFRSISTR